MPAVETLPPLHDEAAPTVALRAPAERAGSGLRVGLAAALVYVACAALYWVAASLLWDAGNKAGAVVSDAVSWHRSFAAVTPERPLMMARPGFFYYELYKISPHLTTLINLGLLSAAIVITTVAVQRAAGRQAALIAGFVMALNPWCWVLTLGPTKEPYALLATSATALFCVSPGRRTGALGVVACAVEALVRLEQALMLLVVMAGVVIVRRTRQPRLLLLAIACFAVAGGIVLFAAGQWLMGGNFFNLSPQLWPLASTHVEGPEAAVGELGRRLSELGWYDPVWNSLAMAYRLVANIMGCLWRLGMRTVDDQLSIVGLGQAITGFIVFAGFVTVACRLRRPQDMLNRGLAMHLLVIWVGASMVAFVQPRYILVELPVALVALASATPLLRGKVLAGCLAFGLAGRLAFAAAGYGIPRDHPLPGPRPSFLLEIDGGRILPPLFGQTGAGLAGTRQLKLSQVDSDRIEAGWDEADHIDARRLASDELELARPELDQLRSADFAPGRCGAVHDGLARTGPQDLRPWRL